MEIHLLMDDNVTQKTKTVLNKLYRKGEYETTYYKLYHD